MAIRIAIIGYGKIAQDQHVPAIAADPRFDLVALVSPRTAPGLALPCFASTSDLIAGMAGRLDAVAVCTPPGVRHAIAREALAAGLAVLLEKPPAATLGEIEDLERIARARGAGLYTGWHSQHAAAVPHARAALAGTAVASLRIEWFEDVRKWHPGQEWIWTPAGFGVFDPGINALSIAAHILPEPLFVRDALLETPANKQAPIAAGLTFAGEAMTAAFDWRYRDGERWTIAVATADGRRIELRDGGARLRINGNEQPVEGPGEYPSIYDRFATIARERQVAVDREPLRIVADAFMVARRALVDPFD